MDFALGTLNEQSWPTTCTCGIWDPKGRQLSCFAVNSAGDTIAVAAQHSTSVTCKRNAVDILNTYGNKKIDKSENWNDGKDYEEMNNNNVSRLGNLEAYSNSKICRGKNMNNQLDSVYDEARSARCLDPLIVEHCNGRSRCKRTRKRKSKCDVRLNTPENGVTAIVLFDAACRRPYTEIIPAGDWNSCTFLEFALQDHLLIAIFKMNSTTISDSASYTSFPISFSESTTTPLLDDLSTSSSMSFIPSNDVGCCAKIFSLMERPIVEIAHMEFAPAEELVAVSILGVYGNLKYSSDLITCNSQFHSDHPYVDFVACFRHRGPMRQHFDLCTQQRVANSCYPLLLPNRMAPIEILLGRSAPFESYSETHKRFSNSIRSVSVCLFRRVECQAFRYYHWPAFLGAIDPPQQAPESACFAYKYIMAKEDGVPPALQPPLSAIEECLGSTIAHHTVRSYYHRTLLLSSPVPQLFPTYLNEIPDVHHISTMRSTSNCSPSLIPHTHSSINANNSLSTVIDSIKSPSSITTCKSPTSGNADTTLAADVYCFENLDYSRTLRDVDHGMLVVVALPSGIVLIVDLYQRIVGLAKVADKNTPVERLEARKDGQLLICLHKNALTVLAIEYPSNDKWEQFWITASTHKIVKVTDLKNFYLGTSETVLSEEVRRNSYIQEPNENYNIDSCNIHCGQKSRKVLHSNFGIGNQNDYILRINKRFVLPFDCPKMAYIDCCISDDPIMHWIFALSFKYAKSYTLHVLDSYEITAKSALKEELDVSNLANIKQLKWLPQTSSLLILGTNGFCLAVIQREHIMSFNGVFTKDYYIRSGLRTNVEGLIRESEYDLDEHFYLDKLSERTQRDKVAAQSARISSTIHLRKSLMCTDGAIGILKDWEKSEVNFGATTKRSECTMCRGQSVYYLPIMAPAPTAPAYHMCAVDGLGRRLELQIHHFPLFYSCFSREYDQIIFEDAHKQSGDDGYQTYRSDSSIINQSTSESCLEIHVGEKLLHTFKGILFWTSISRCTTLERRFDYPSVLDIQAPLV